MGGEIEGMLQAGNTIPGPHMALPGHVIAAMRAGQTPGMLGGLLGGMGRGGGQQMSLGLGSGFPSEMGGGIGGRGFPLRLTPPALMVSGRS